jgi:O-antigen/teichoic acid export membrane protein
VASLFRNIAHLSLGDFLAKALNFLAFVWLARVLGVSEFGVLEFAGSLLTWFLLLGDGGLELWATREAARTSDLRGLVARVAPLRFLLATASFVLLFLCLPVLPGGARLQVVMALFGLSLFAQAATLKWVFMGRERMAAVARMMVVGQVVFAVAVFALIRRPEQVIWVPVLRLAGDLGVALGFARLFRREHGGLLLPYTFAGARLTLTPALTLGLSQAMGLLNFNFDSILLGFLRGLREVGFYNAAYKPVTVALQLPLTYFIGLFPALSRTYAESREAFQALVIRSFRLCTIFAIPLGVGGTMLAAPIIQLLFGADYADSVAPFSILVWSAVFVILRGSARHGLNAAGHQALDLKCALLSAGLNVGLNILLIPRYGMLGSACATVVADVVWFAAVLYFFHRTAGRLPIAGILVRPMLAGVVMGATLWYGAVLQWMVRGAVATAVYFAVLLALGDPELKRLMSREESKEKT